MQHERKPVIDKKEFGGGNSGSFGLNPVNKIFIRKDLSTDSGGLLPPHLTCDLGLPFLKRLG